MKASMRISHFVVATFLLCGCENTRSAECLDDPVSVSLCTKNHNVRLTVRANGTDCICKPDTSPENVREDYVLEPSIPAAYKLHTEPKTWNEARKVCSQEGAHLAIINNQAEEKLLVEKLRELGKAIKGAANREEAFIGIHDLFNEGEWVTVFGESIYAAGYSNWSTTYWGGQPDNYQGNQNCGALINIGGMDDVHCNAKFAFICEMPIGCAQS